MCSNKVNQINFKEHVASTCTPVKAEPFSVISTHVRNSDVKKKKKDPSTTFLYAIHAIRHLISAWIF